MMQVPLEGGPEMLEEYTAWEAKQGKVRARVIMYGERDAAVRLPLNERAIPLHLEALPLT